MANDESGEIIPIPLEDFEACDPEGPIATLNRTDMFSLSQAYQQAAALAQPPCQGVYSLFSALCSIHLNPAERGNVWSPGMSFGPRRSLIPSDVRGAQCNSLEEKLPTIKHPGLRARLADVVWSNDLRKGAAAKIAIDAYCECIDGLVSGHLVPAHEVDALYLIDAQRLAHRALQIASATSKRGTLPQRLKDTIGGLYDDALSKEWHVPFGKTAQLAVDYKVLDEGRVAADAEAIATKGHSAYAEAVRLVLDYASVLYRRLGDTAAQERCELRAIRQLLVMRDGCSQAGAKASWVMDALLRLRNVKSAEAQSLESELETELRSLQRAAVREMGFFPISVEIPEERDRILSHFQEVDLATALRDYVFLATAPAVPDLRAKALEEGRRSGLGSMFAAQHVDHEGRTVVRTAALGRGEPPDDWYVHQIAQAESLRRAFTVTNSIEPVRLLIGSKVVLEERHFNPIVWQSPFVPKTQAPLYALGFSRFFQGDFPSAAHLLIPQLEPSLRHILKTYGVDPTKRRDDATEEDQSLDGIITNHRAVLEELLGADLLEELNRIFNVQPGPNLRHEMAHGQISANECYTANVIYGCWFLYRLVCLPLVENWDTWVRPGLKDEGLPGV